MIIPDREESLECKNTKFKYIFHKIIRRIKNLINSPRELNSVD